MMNDVRCVVVLNSALTVGKAANAAAVLSLTLGQRHPHLVGDALADASGQCYPGLIPVGIPVLSADNTQLSVLLECCESSSLMRLSFRRRAR